MLATCGGKSTQEKTIDYNQRLWYTYPAEYWNSQALHLGNSYFGVSFFGGVEREIFSLSEQSMWRGQPAQGSWEKVGVNPKALETLPAIRTAVVNGQAQLADSLIAENFFGSSEWYGHFTSIGDLDIQFGHQLDEAQHYRRSLDLSQSVGTVEYEWEGTQYRREYFCSYPDRMLGAKFSAEGAGTLSFSVGLEAMQDSVSIKVSDNEFLARGYINGNLRPFEVRVWVDAEGGTLGNDGDRLTVTGAEEAMLYLTTATNYAMDYPDYVGEDPSVITRSVLEKAAAKGYDALKRDHIADYQNLYERVHFEVPGNPAVESLPTNERFEDLRAGKSDPGYKTLAFNLGRYMVISASRPGSLPANLQGVWNAFPVAPWAGNYQSNINIQEIYWACGPTNLLECQQSYIDWIEDLAISGREVAKRVYGTDGWISHTTGNIWGHATPIGNHPWGMYSMGSAWHCQHVWDHFAFGQDTAYLRQQAYPLLKDASIFWLQNLIPFEGYLITAPSISAEHGALMTEDGLNPAFHDFKSDQYHYSLPGIYQDMQMLWDLFTNTSKAATILGKTVFADSLLDVRAQLLPPKIGKHGQLQEWYQDIDHPDAHHRHIPHLYAVCPGYQMHPTTTPELAEAAKVSLNMRGDGRYLEQELASGGNWSRAHRMGCWVRLMDGNRADKILTEILTEQGFENVLTHQHADYDMGRGDFYQEDGLSLHFQLDATGAIPGMITEMFLQSHLGNLLLLPAVPDEFATGKITGICARGGYTLDLEWKDKKLVKAVIYGEADANPSVLLEGKEVQIGDDPRIEFRTL